MTSISDLERSLKQFREHERLKYLALTRKHKFLLGISFFLLIPFMIFGLFPKRLKDKNIYILDYGEQEPYKSINELIKKERLFKFIQLPKFYLPRLPHIFIRDIWSVFKNHPVYFWRNLDFFGALSIKISHYYSLIQKNNIQYFTVLQEYSFYSSYLTRIMENEEGKLFNIQHGVPGKTYAYFRFSKMFIWGEYFKEQYIKNGAYPNQFEITGSIIHSSKKMKIENTENIDILFIMQGKQKELNDVFDVLEDLSDRYNIQYIQHPRHYIPLNTSLKECKLNIWEALYRSEKILSHYSTALLDARWLGKEAVAYTSSKYQEYVAYLPERNIILNKNELKKILDSPVKKYSKLDPYYIVHEKDPVIKIEEAIKKCIKQR